MVITGTSNEICFELERLFLHLALIDDDSKLEAFVQKHLLDIIQCTSSGETNIRSKGMEMLTHLNRRIKTNLSITLPLEDILQYVLIATAERNVLGTNFAIVYLRMALDRADTKQHIDMLPKLLDALVKNASDRKIFDQLVVLTARAWIAIADINREKWPSLEAMKEEAVKPELLRFFSDVLYFADASGERRAFSLRQLDSSSSHPCMSKNGFLRIAKDVLNDSKVSITALKLATIKVISSGIFAEAEILPLLIGAVALGPGEVEMAGDVAMKKIDLEEALKNKNTINSLFSLYLGSSSQKLNEDDKISPAAVPVQMKLMPLFMRSPVAVQMFPHNIKIAFDGLFSKDEDIAKPVKLQQASVEFLLLVVKNFPSDALPTVGPVIFSSMRKLIDQNEFPNVVAVAYQCFGIIGCKVPRLVVSDMALLQETFDAIPRAPEEVSFAITDCLVSWLPAFCSVDDAALIGVLQALVSSYIVHESPKCRLVALKYVEALLKTPSLEFRWMLCRACGDPRDEMKREAIRLLDLSISDPKSVPKFDELVEFVHRKLNLQDVTDELNLAAEAKKKKEAFADEVFHILAMYLYASVQAACSLQPLSLTEVNVVSKPTDYPVISSYLITTSKRHPETVHFFLEIVIKAVEAQPVDFLIDIACLLLHCGSGNLDDSYRAAIVPSIERHLCSNARTAVCARLAQLHVLLLNDVERKICLDQCLRECDSSEELLVRVPWLCAYLATQPSTNITAGEITKIRRRLVNIIGTVSTQPNQCFEAACGSLAELLRRAVFALSDAEKAKLASSFSDDEFCSLCEVLGKVATSRKDILTSKVKESVVQCLGFLSSHSLSSTLYEKILAQLFASGEVATQPELQFTVGNAFFDAAFGESSSSRRNVFVETEEAFLETNLSVANRNVIEKKVTDLIEVLINEKLRHANRHLRQAALIWLFVLVKQSSVVKLNSVLNVLGTMQRAFINGLTETNEFSQEVASEGLGVIFELATEKQKKEMVEELVDTLSVGRKRAVPIAPDTQLFAKGELGTAPSGENLTTYQELCNLATDLNQPDLVYKFMQLANHNTLWNSKKGAAYGFAVVMQQAKDALEPYLAQLVPKLYRYRYDPDLKVQGAMRTIWKSMTASKKNVTEQYADAIFKELSSTLTDSQWRARESSCLALADLISAQCTTKMMEHFGELFQVLYRVQDDVKESVRVAAGRALSSLSKVTVRKCSSANGAKATRLLGIVLPVIVEKGVDSNVKINKMLSLKILMDISKEAGSALCEHLNIVVPCLLDSLSETESTFLNYLAARSSLDELEVLDGARASVAHSSPMMTALHDIVPYVDENVFNSLGDKLIEKLRTSVGLTTRTGTCQFITDLCLRRQQLLMSCRSSCDKMVRVLLNGLNDRNPTVKKQFSSCLSYLLPFCSKTEVNRVLDCIKQKLRSEQDDEKISILHLLRALSKNTEVLTESASAIVPYVFLYKCQEIAKDDETGKKQLEMWDELWSELVPDTNSAMRLYRKEMIELAMATVNTSSVFAIRAQAATALTAVAESGAASDDATEADILYDSLIGALRGRVWDGKEKLIRAITALLRSVGKKMASKWDEATVEKKFSPLWEQCLKKNKKYNAEAIRCAAVFCEIAACKKIAQQLLSHIDNIMNHDQSESDSDDAVNGASSATRLKTYDYLIQIVPTFAHLLLAFSGAELSYGVERAVALLESETFWKVKQALIIELPYFLERCASEVDFTSLFVAVALLLTENDISQRHTFAQQCCTVLERIVKRAQNRECYLLLDKHKETVEKLKNTTIVQSSAVLDCFLK